MDIFVELKIGLELDIKCNILDMNLITAYFILNGV